MKPRRRLFVFALALMICSVRAEDGPKVDAPVGTIHGRTRTIDDVGVDEFLGIPYARPPIGKLRFALPAPFGPVGNLRATEFIARCPQPLLSPLLQNPVPTAEDCLHLNVFRKSGTKQGDAKAVIVVLHGGAFCIGSAADTNTGILSALGDVIVVTPNYRLGVLGFADMKDLAPGNLGLYDQRLALEWVQDNIRAFGGNPDKVTLFGASAGSMSVSAQINSPVNREGRPLFHAAIMDAGVAAPGIVVDADLSLKRIKSIAEKLACPTKGPKMLDCIRKADVNELIKLSYNPEEYSPIYTFHPTVDGKFIPRDVAKDVRDNAKGFMKVKMLIGTSKDEGTMFASNRIDFTGDFFMNLTTEGEFLDHIGRLAAGFKFPLNLTDSDVRRKVTDAYYQKSSSRFLDAAAFVGDGIFICPTNAFVRSYSKTHPNVHAFRFERVVRQANFFFDPKKLGVFHTSFTLYACGSVIAFETVTPNEPANAEDNAFSLDVIQVVTNFAKSDASPEFRGVKWPDFGKGEGVMVLDEKPRVEKGLFSEDRCEKVFPFFESAP